MSSKLFSMHAMPVLVTATAQIGASGAVSSFVGSMVKSFEKVSTGIYLITMDDKTNFTRLYAAMGSMQSPAVGLAGISTIEIQNDPNSDVQTTTGAKLTIKTLDAAGALANPANGSAINIMAIMSNSSVIVGGE